MTWAATARAALQACEAVLRRLVAEAAAAGDYDAVVTLTRWASGIRHLGTPSAPAPESVRSPGAASQGPALRRPDLRTPVHARRSQRGTRAVSPPSNVYPRFVRRGSELVKVGWSKRSRTEYEHRASRQVVNRTVELLAKAASGDELLRIETLLPPVGAQGNIPVYQVYVVLAWLRAEGLVKQHGRQGYSIADPRALGTQVDDRWQALLES